MATRKTSMTLCSLPLNPNDLCGGRESEGGGSGKSVGGRLGCRQGWTGGGEVGGEDGTPTVGADKDDDGKDEAADTASGDTDGKPTFGTDDDDDGEDESVDTVSAASGDTDVRGDLLSSKDRRRRYWLDYECRTLRRQRMTNPWTLPRTGID